MRFSCKTGGGYPERFKYKGLPDDLVTITDEEHRVLIHGRAAGQLIVAGADGKPVLVNPPAPDPALLLKSAAAEALTKSDVVLLQFLEDGGTIPPSWGAYRKALRAIVDRTDQTSTELPPIPPYPAGT
jgi:hypothetical protein